MEHGHSVHHPNRGRSLGMFWRNVACPDVLSSSGTKKDGERSSRPVLATAIFSATSLCGFLVSFIFRFALLHQVTVLACHRGCHKRLLAEFAATGLSVGGGLLANGEA